MAVTSSSTLLAKLEAINWCYSINAVLQGVNSNLLVKYIIEDNAYAIMLSDFSSTYFECLFGQQLEQHFARFNSKAKRLTCEQILVYLAEWLQDLRISNTLSFEKLEVDCHTSRITVKASKIFTNIKIAWSFYSISTEQDIFLKHFSIPLWRGLMHFYQLSQGQNSHSNDSENSEAITTTTTNNNGHHNNHTGRPAIRNNAVQAAGQFPFALDDDLLKEVFR